MSVHPMWNNYPRLKKDLAATIQLIDSNIKVRDQYIAETVKQLVYSGGKLLRPAFALLCSQIGPDKNKDRAIAVAAALECLHMATLVHDDVIDESDTRHGIGTIHSKNGNKYATYAGDYLFTLCFIILANHSSSFTSMQYNARGMHRILTGELEQLQSRFKEPTSIKNYLSRISGKTAQLFATSCYSGAIESGASKRLAMHAWNMGHHIGMAFQILDDILDYKSDEKTLGKPVMNDIRQGIYTLPLIYAMQDAPDEFRPILSKKDNLDDNDIDMLNELIHKYSGIEKAELLAQKYTKKAINELNKLPDGDYKYQLMEIFKFLLNRKV